MPHLPKTHEDNQNGICGICMTKPKHQLRNISATCLEEIRKLVFADYHKSQEECGADWTWLPHKMCASCHRSLAKAWSNEKKRQEEGLDAVPLHGHISHVDYLELKPPTRISNIFPLCRCSLCEIGRMKNKEYEKHVATVKEPRGRPVELTPEKDPQPMLICDKCFTEVGVGKSHNKDLCKAATRRMNVVQAISESGDRTRRQILTEGLQQVMDEEGCLGKGDTVTLPRVHDPPLTIIAERGLDPERTIVQIGLDDGQGLIKVMMTIKTLEDDQHLVPMDKKRRSSYSDYAPLKFKDSGVQKLMLLAVAPVCEKYENLTYIMHGEARPQWV